jgi:hypothetical protein
MKKIELGAKVLWPGRFSAIVSRHNKGHKTYPKGEWVYPNKGCGPLAVFASPEQAFAWPLSFLNWIVPCEYVPSKKKHLWSFHEGGKEVTHLRALPPGTVLADAVRCLE